jgi:hypothetical protein
METTRINRLRVGNYLFENGTNVYKSFMETNDRWFSGARLFGAVDKHDRHYFQLVKECDIIELVKTNNFNLCELLTSYPRRVYFDIDDNEATLKRRDVIKILKRHFGLEEHMYTIAGYEEKDKVSYHIVSCYVLRNADELEKMKQLVKYVKSLGGSCAKFDDLVYTKNRQMKCIFQSKPNKHMAKPLKENNLDEFFINSFIPDNALPYFEEIKIPFKTLEAVNTIIKPEPIATYTKALPVDIVDKDFYDAKYLLSLTPSEHDQPHSHRWKVALFCYFNGIKEDDYLEWFYKSNPNEQRAKKVKQFWKELPKHEEYKITIPCFKKYLSQWYPELLMSNNPSTDKFINSFDLASNHKIKMIKRIKDKYFNINKRVLIFNIGMGGGKTTTTLDYLRKSKDSFIWLAPRQTLVLNTSHRMDTEFTIKHVSHLNVGRDKSKLTKTDKLLICNQSLHYLEDKQKFNTVVIDEIETVLLSWLDEETHKDNMGDNFKRFCKLLQSAKKIILLDAFTTIKTINILNKLGIKNKDIKIYASTHKPAEKKIIINNDFEKMLNMIVDDIYNKRKCYIFYPYKNATETTHYGIREFDQKVKQLVKKRYIDKCKTPEEKLKYYEGGDVCRSLLYFAESKEKNNLGNINELWADVDYIMTTSSITVGVNYEGMDYHKVYLIVSGSTNNPRDVIQSSMRIRYPISNELNVLFFDVNNKEFKKFPKYYLENNDDIYKSLTLDNLHEIQADFVDSFFRFCDLTNYTKPEEYIKLINQKKKKFQNDLFVSRMLMDYVSIKKVGEMTIPEYEEKVYNREASLEDRMIVERFYFDSIFKNLNEDDRAYIWNSNSKQFFKGMFNPLIDMIIKDNEVKTLLELNVNKLTMSKETVSIIKKQYSTEKTKPDWLARETINNILGKSIIQSSKKNGKQRGFKFAGEATELFDLHTKKIKADEEAKKEKERIEFIEEEEHKTKYQKAYEFRLTLTDDDYFWKYDKDYDETYLCCKYDIRKMFDL